jgi:hypothetical protein
MPVISHDCEPERIGPGEPGGGPGGSHPIQIGPALPPPRVCGALDILFKSLDFTTSLGLQGSATLPFLGRVGGGLRIFKNNNTQESGMEISASLGRLIGGSIMRTINPGMSSNPIAGPQFLGTLAGFTRNFTTGETTPPSANIPILGAAVILGLEISLNTERIEALSSQCDVFKEDLMRNRRPFP